MQVTAGVVRFLVRKVLFRQRLMIGNVPGGRFDIESRLPIVGKHSGEEAAMPTYEYQCTDCKKTFEIVRSIKENGRKAIKCPKCEGKKVERRWSSVFVETSRKS